MSHNPGKGLWRALGLGSTYQCQFRSWSLDLLTQRHRAVCIAVSCYATVHNAVLWTVPPSLSFPASEQEKFHLFWLLCYNCNVECEYVYSHNFKKNKGSLYQKQSSELLIFRFCCAAVFCILVLRTCHRRSKNRAVEIPLHLAKQACASHLLQLLTENSSKFLQLLPKKLYCSAEMSYKVPCKRHLVCIVIYMTYM